MSADTHFPIAWNTGLLLVTLVVLALVVNRFASDKRRYLRHLVFLVSAHLVGLGVAFGLDLGGLGGVALTRSIADVLGLYGWAAATTMFVFHVALPRLRVTVASIVSDLAAAALYIVATFIGMKRAGLDLGGILTTSAVVGGILALSLQATLGNVIGGLALQIDNSITVGDWIQLENGRQGRVRQIRWRHTVLETRDWGTLIVPNAALLQAQILILGKRENEPLQHRYWVHFNVDFRFNPSDVIDTVEAALLRAKIPGVAEHPKANCVCLDFARDNKDSFALYAVRYWLTDLARDDPTNSLVRERIFSALKRANIPLAVPAAQLWVEQDNEERRERKRKREHDKRMKAMRAVEFLRSLNEEELAELCDQLHFAPFAEGEVLTLQGAIAHHLYIVAEGTVEVRVSSNGEDKTIATIEAPGFFGERGLMTGEPRGATVVATTDVETYRLDKMTFRSTLENRPELATIISEAFAERQVALEDAREHLDAAARSARVVERKTQLLSRIQRFFGLDDAASSRN